MYILTVFNGNLTFSDVSVDLSDAYHQLSKCPFKGRFMRGAPRTRPLE